MPPEPHVHDAMERATVHVPEVVRVFMRMAEVDRYGVAAALGLTPTQLTRRLSVPGALGQHELAGLAAYFGVSVDVFYREIPEALTELGEALRSDERWAGSRRRSRRVEVDRLD